MGLNYLVTKRIFGFDETKSEQYVTRAIKSGTLDFETLCEKLSMLCGVHRGIVQLVLSTMGDVAMLELEDGKSVQLGDFGTFRVSVNAKAVKEEKDALASTIYRRRIVFTPGVRIKSRLERTPMTRYVAPDADWTKSGNNTGDEDDDGWQDPNA